jgi:hypothetical protein
MALLSRGWWRRGWGCSRWGRRLYIVDPLSGYIAVSSCCRLLLLVTVPISHGRLGWWWLSVAAIWSTTVHLSATRTAAIATTSGGGIAVTAT